MQLPNHVSELDESIQFGRLSKVCIRSQAEELLPFGIGIGSGSYDHGRLGTLASCADMTQDFQTVFFWKVDIEDDEIRARGGRIHFRRIQELCGLFSVADEMDAGGDMR